MAHVYFKCKCGKSLAVDEAGIGHKINCSDCDQAITVPRPKVGFNCGQCKDDMLAPTALIGDKVRCVSCRNMMVIPSASDPDVSVFFTCTKCRQHLDAPTDMAGEEITCPNCDHITSTRASFRTQINYPISIFDNVQVMFNNNNSIAHIYKFF